jgi:cardiolipin synthase
LRHDLADALFCAVDHARHHVYLENPYLSDGRLLLRLMRARGRGVDVRVVLTLCASEDIANRANRVTANFLLRAGVRVYLYPGATHLKALTVDGAWAYVGTGNFDPRSLRYDCELGVALGEGPVIREIEEEVLGPSFRPDCELKEPLPVKPADRLSEVLAALFG